MGEDLKLLFFDMEFANGKIPGSVFSFGYLMTDEEFNIVTPPADICINPDCKWNEYVAKNILAYPMETIEASPLFPDCYEAIKALFAEADIAASLLDGSPDMTAFEGGRVLVINWEDTPQELSVDWSIAGNVQK